MRFRVDQHRIGGTVSVEKVLSELFVQYPTLACAYTIETIRNAWPETTGDFISDQSIPDRIENGVLFVKVRHSAVGNELMMRQETIFDVINKLTGDNIHHIRTEHWRKPWKKTN